MKRSSKIISMALSASIVLSGLVPVLATAAEEINVALQMKDGVNTVSIDASYSSENTSSLSVPEAVFDGKSDDGNGANKWYVPASKSSGAWINVDLNSVCTISSIKVYSGYGNITETSDKLVSYDIYYSDNDVTDTSSNDEYTLLTSVEAENGLHEITFEAVPARNVKVVSTQDTAFRIREIEIFGTLGDPGELESTPKIDLTTTVDGYRIQSGTTVGLNAVATVGTGEIKDVSFYCDDSKIEAEVSSQGSEYSCEFIPSIGTHTIKASATSDKDITSYSNEIVINVTDNVLPTVSMNDNINGKVYSPYDKITLTASASDLDGAVQSVTFFNFGEPIEAETIDNGDGTYSAVIIAQPGYYRITAQAVDEAGESVMSSPVDFKAAYTNIASGIVPTSSEAEGGSDSTSSLAALTDGIINVSPMGGSKYYLRNIGSAYIEFDLGEQQEVMGGMVYSGDIKNASSSFNDVAKNFYYQYYNGEDWIDIPESKVTDNTSNGVYSEFPAKVTTDKIRIVFTDITSMRLVEIELYTVDDFIITDSEASEFESGKPYSVSRTIKNTTGENSEAVMVVALYDNDELVELDVTEQMVIGAGEQQKFEAEINIPDVALNNSRIKLIMLKNFSSLKPLLPAEIIIPDALSGKLAVSSVFGDGMVLQREKPIHVWGLGLDGDVITVELNGKSKQTTVQNGEWEVYLDPESAGGPYTMSIEGQYESKIINDILIGEVWLCSGQSNMNMTLAWSEGSAISDEISGANYPEIRAFRANVSGSSEPQFSVDSRYWEKASSSTVGAWSAAAYYFAKNLHQELDVPVGIIVSALGGTDIQTWISAEGIKPVEDLVTDERRPYVSRNYNNAIAPVAGYTLKGFVWYQGENNARLEDSEVFNYGKFQKALIDDWREKFGDGSLPFYITQLPNMIRESSPVWQYLREQQLETVMNVDNTGMAVTIDVGDPLDIHPHNKAPVGYRLALLALDNAYGKDIVSSGPVFTGMDIDGSNVILHFDTYGSSLVLKDDKLHSGFMICGDDKVFHHAEAQVSGNDIILSCDEVTAPIAARYAFANNPYVTLFNTEGLPASPFRTDSFGIDEAVMPDDAEDLSALQ